MQSSELSTIPFPGDTNDTPPVTREATIAEARDAIADNLYSKFNSVHGDGRFFTDDYPGNEEPRNNMAGSLSRNDTDLNDPNVFNGL